MTSCRCGASKMYKNITIDQKPIDKFKLQNLGSFMNSLESNKGALLYTDLKHKVINLISCIFFTINLSIKDNITKIYQLFLKEENVASTFQAVNTAINTSIDNLKEVPLQMINKIFEKLVMCDNDTFKTIINDKLNTFKDTKVLDKTLLNLTFTNPLKNFLNTISNTDITIEDINREYKQYEEEILILNKQLETHFDSIISKEEYELIFNETKTHCNQISSEWESLDSFINEILQNTYVIKTILNFQDNNFIINNDYIQAISEYEIAQHIMSIDKLYQASSSYETDKNKLISFKDPQELQGGNNSTSSSDSSDDSDSSEQNRERDISDLFDRIAKIKTPFLIETKVELIMILGSIAQTPVFKTQSFNKTKSDITTDDFNILEVDENKKIQKIDAIEIPFKAAENCMSLINHHNKNQEVNILQMSTNINDKKKNITYIYDTFSKLKFFEKNNKTMYNVNPKKFCKLLLNCTYSNKKKLLENCSIFILGCILGVNINDGFDEHVIEGTEHSGGESDDLVVVGPDGVPVDPNDDASQASGSSGSGSSGSGSSGSSGSGIVFSEESDAGKPNPDISGGSIQIFNGGVYNKRKNKNKSMHYFTQTGRGEGFNGGSPEGSATPAGSETPAVQDRPADAVSDTPADAGPPVPPVPPGPPGAPVPPGPPGAPSATPGPPSATPGHPSATPRKSTKKSKTKKKSDSQTSNKSYFYNNSTNNLNTCVQYFVNEQWWSNFISDMKSVHPLVILCILEVFHFQIKEIKFSNDIFFNRYESAEEWMKGTLPNLLQQDPLFIEKSEQEQYELLSKIQSNNKLIKLLNGYVSLCPLLFLNNPHTLKDKLKKFSSENYIINNSIYNNENPTQRLSFMLKPLPYSLPIWHPIIGGNGNIKNNFTLKKYLNHQLYNIYNNINSLKYSKNINNILIGGNGDNEDVEEKTYKKTYQEYISSLVENSIINKLKKVQQLLKKNQVTTKEFDTIIDQRINNMEIEFKKMYKVHEFLAKLAKLSKNKEEFINEFGNIGTPGYASLEDIIIKLSQKMDKYTKETYNSLSETYKFIQNLLTGQSSHLNKTTRGFFIPSR